MTNFSPNDTNVICSQLGFPLGASQALLYSTFGPGYPILMDNVMCRGNKRSFADCMLLKYLPVSVVSPAGEFTTVFPKRYDHNEIITGVALPSSLSILSSQPPIAWKIFPSDIEDQFTVEQMHLPKELGQGGHLNNDIALFRVKTKGNRDLRFDSHAQPLCLPTPDTAYVPGTNRTSGPPKRGGPEVHLVNPEQHLQSNYNRLPFRFRWMERVKHLTCGVDACLGYSGGGLVCLVDGKLTLMEVISWGFGCGRPSRPDVYTRVVHCLPYTLSADFNGSAQVLFLALFFPVNIIPYRPETMELIDILVSSILMENDY
ncbi:hypothetical protein OUZ56_020084 [Daphnia magna]|uniref:Peptidase S1 domain-containing protein n=1 Tax=Daphnia magna TaxID=35525 RepID=A0ABQ9ZDH7_9CRUS|nr:hypothetical protein OUZ56_020084 [Daphnia magna]